MNDHTLQTCMREATRLTLAGQLSQATSVIQRALGRSAQGDGDASHDHAYMPEPLRRPPHDATSMVLEGLVFEVPVGPSLRDKSPMRAPPMRDEPSRPTDGPAFIAGTHAHASLTRHYKLYVPPGHAGKPLPLVVMLHGCTQNPDDFAAGTAMNERAFEQGFFVLYPAQAQDANPSRCWNWFKHTHQQRGRGEPALIADMVQTLVKQYGMDASRVYIAGLSAGGAMAAIVAQAYPDIFAAVGIHSGLPHGSASNVAEALAVMKSGGPVHGAQGRSMRMAPTPSAPTHPGAAVPTIVFHGDQDQTVHPRNGDQVIEGIMGKVAATGAAPQVARGTAPGGRRYTSTVHHDGNGRALAEHWVVHEAGHAWSGGQAAGSYTDAKGPDATREMLRFFFTHSQGTGH